jgi:serine/threonine-protein kinase Chk2
VGAFSEVKMAVERATGRLVAVKMLDKFRYTGGTRTGESLSREVEILKRLSHPNIIQILDVVDTERMLFIVLELASGGELFEQIAKRTRHTEDEARHVFEQLLRAIQYLHSNNICHRDIKPENVLLEGDVVKLTDFGFSRVVGEAEMMKTMCGTPCYLAPEVLAMAMGTKEPEFESAYGYGKVRVCQSFFLSFSSLSRLSTCGRSVLFFLFCSLGGLRGTTPTLATCARRC